MHGVLFRHCFSWLQFFSKWKKKSVLIIENASNKPNKNQHQHLRTIAFFDALLVPYSRQWCDESSFRNQQSLDLQYCDMIQMISKKLNQDLGSFSRGWLITSWTKIRDWQLKNWKFKCFKIDNFPTNFFIRLAKKKQTIIILYYINKRMFWFFFCFVLFFCWNKIFFIKYSFRKQNKPFPTTDGDTWINLICFFVSFNSFETGAVI